MSSDAPIEIGSRRELFVDDFLLDYCTGEARLKLHPPCRREIVLQVCGELENACSGVYSVLVENDSQYLLYYRGHYPLQGGGNDAARQQTAHVAVSRDGIHFERPELGLYDCTDGGKNNVIWQGKQAHNFVPFLDRNPNVAADQRFKAVGGSGRDNLCAFYSADGFHWQLAQDEPLRVSGAFDSANLAFWDTVIGKYRLFSRDFTRIDGKNCRIIQSCESDDFIHWTEPHPHEYEPGVSLEEFYTNATTPCPGAEHILLSFPMRYVAERTTPVADISAMDYPGQSGRTGMTGMTDAVIMSSRDGVHWRRPFREAWLRAGLDERNWTHRNNCPGIGILCNQATEWSMYVSEHYGWPDNRLRRLSIRPWGFASINGSAGGGEAVTRPLVFSGRELSLNFSTSAVGSVAVEMQDTDGHPIPGFALEAMTPFYGDRLDWVVDWGGQTDVSELAGRPVRLRFQLKDADVFAFRFMD